MTELEEVRASGKMSERVLENNFRHFDHRLREIEGELKLYPYATLSEVIAWAEQQRMGNLRRKNVGLFADRQSVYSCIF